MSEDSPNTALDKAIKEMLKDLKDQPFDMRCKGLNTAIAWEKAKNAILGKDDDFDADSI